MNTQTSAPPTGARRMSLVMLAVRDQADQFDGMAPGTAKPLTYLAAFQEAEPYLSLPAHAFKLVSWLVRQTMAHDWEKGSRPIAWPSARLQQEFLGLSAARVKALNRALFEAGIFVIRDNEQGKRYGRRGPNKRIIEAYGFDLTPIAQRYEEFVRIAAAARTERNRSKDCRRRITIARRGIRQAGEMLAGLDVAQPAEWSRLVAETGDLVAGARRADRSEDLAVIASALESRQKQVEQWLRVASKPVDTNPVGLVCDPHNTSTNQSLNLKDTVIAAEKSSRAEGAGLDDDMLEPRLERKEEKREIKLSADELLQLAPRLGQYVASLRPTWRDVVDAAGGPLRHELGISSLLWAEACGVMGRDAATLALAIVSTKDEAHFKRSAGGYFAGMVRKCERGELFLEKSLWGLRTNRYGQPPSRSVN
jgi:replication initiation protein RepC